MQVVNIKFRPLYSSYPFNTKFDWPHSQSGRLEKKEKPLSPIPEFEPRIVLSIITIPAPIRNRIACIFLMLFDRPAVGKRETQSFTFHIDWKKKII
jgi:hypothetical protein